MAVLFSRQLHNGSHNFFHIFSTYFFDYLIKNPQITNALTFLRHDISGIGGVKTVHEGLELDGGKGKFAILVNRQ